MTITLCPTKLILLKNSAKNAPKHTFSHIIKNVSHQGIHDHKTAPTICKYVATPVRSNLKLNQTFGLESGVCLRRTQTYRQLEKYSL